MATTARNKKDNGAATTKNRISDVPVERALKIRPLNRTQITFKLQGVSPLMVQAFGPKARREMLEKQMGTSKGTKKAPRCPVEEFLDCFYVVDGTKLPAINVDEATGSRDYDVDEVAKFLESATFGIPLAGFKNAMVSATRNTDYTMAQMKTLIRVLGPDDPVYAVISSPSPPMMDERICRLADSKRTPIERFRPRWDEWSTAITVSFDSNLIVPDEVANLLARAGHEIGICEARAEKTAIGYGCWEIAG